MPEQLNDVEFKSKVEGSKGLVVVDFWAEWCAPCRIVGPEVEKLSKEMEGKISVYKLDVDSNRETAAKFRIMSIPTIMWFRDGKAVDSVLGAVPYEVLEQKTKELITEV